MESSKILLRLLFKQTVSQTERGDLDWIHSTDRRVVCKNSSSSNVHEEERMFQKVILSPITCPALAPIPGFTTCPCPMPAPSSAAYLVPAPSLARPYPQPHPLLSPIASLLSGPSKNFSILLFSENNY